MKRRQASQLLHRFAEAGRLYRGQFMNPSWTRFPEFERNAWDGLALFLSSYAFEHQGRNPRYSAVAVEVTQSLKAIGYELNESTAEEAWRRFSAKLKGQGLNPDRNPMRYKPGHNKRSAIEVTAQRVKSLPTDMRDLLQEGNVTCAHNVLRQINGVGDKIASLFLRDVASFYDLSPPSQDRYLLQPVDIWVRRAASAALGVSPQDDIELAHEIVLECARSGTNPEHANQGMWYVGALIAGSPDEFEQAIRAPLELDMKVHDYVGRLKSAVVAYESAS